ncbi:MAG: LysR family transcriptional regulator [Verrucomicrobiales bacterium]
MNNSISTLPFEIYELHLFHLIAKYASFTRAAAKAHITQSAITRQIQGMEKKLGASLFTRNTRHVTLTEAGHLLYARSSELLKQVEDAVSEIEELKKGKTEFLQVGVCRSIGLSYLPGFFVGFRRKYPKVQLRIDTNTSPEIVARVMAGELDIGVIHALPALPRQISGVHKIIDEFTFIYPAQHKEVGTIDEIIQRLPLMMPQPKSHSRELIDGWMTLKKLQVKPAMELDNFDLIVNLVLLGLGCSIVPHRALPLYLQRGLIARLPINPRLHRTLLVIIRKSSKAENLLNDFISEILF